MRYSVGADNIEDSEVPKLQPISAGRHAALRWKRLPEFSFAKTDAAVPVTVAEMPRAALSLPLAFAPAPGDLHLPVAVLGYQAGKNLCVGSGDRWVPEYVPAAYRGYPFVLASLDDGRQVLCIDEEGGLASESEPGVPFYEADGEKPSEPVRQVFDFLTKVAENRAQTIRIGELLKKHALIQPWPLKLQVGDKEREVTGLFRIDEAAFQALSSEAFDELRKAGALTLIYSQLLSMPNIRKLADYARQGTRAVRRPAARAQQASQAAAAAGAKPANEPREIDFDFLERGGTIDFGGSGNN